MSQYELPAFTKQYEQALASDAASKKADRLKKYTRASAWADSDEDKNCVPSGVIVPSTLGSLLARGQQNDAHNAALLHKAIRLTPAQAADPCLWARLAHVELWGYMQGRWRPEVKQPTEEEIAKRRGRPRKVLSNEELLKKASGFVVRRYFVAQRNSRHLMRHGVARLWWAAELTHEGGEYKDIDILLWMPEVAERQYGQYPHVLKTLLRFIAVKRAALQKKGKTKKLRSNYFRPLLKRLNQHGGHTQLGQLDPEEIENFLQKAFFRIQVAVSAARRARKAKSAKA